MNKIQKAGLVIFLITIFYSCKNKSATSEESATEVIANELVNDSVVHSLPAKATIKSSQRKVVRTADIKFRVKNVTKSTDAIEAATTKFGGFVSYTNLESRVVDSTQTKISQDSTLINTKYSVANNLVLRVPNTRLDTVIKIVAKQIEFLDTRFIKEDDVTLQLLSNKMAQNSSENTQNRIENAINKKGKKLNQIIDAEDNLNKMKTQSDARILENLALNDQINFSTLSLKIYQNQAIRQEVIANEKSINAYRPNIGLQIFEGLKTGWFMLEVIIAFIVQLWGIALIIFLIWIGYKLFSKKKLIV